MKVVLDTNVWVSGLLWAGVPGRILSLAQNRQITILASEALLNELETTLGYAKLQRRLQSLGVTMEALMLLVQQLVELCATLPLNVAQLRDPNDTVILAAAIAADADAIVTGDQDLLMLSQFAGVPILTPQAFLNFFFPNLEDYTS